MRSLLRICHIKLKQYGFKQALVASLLVFPTTKSGNVYQTLEKWFPNYANNEKFTQNMPHQIKVIWLQIGLQLQQGGIWHIKLKQYVFKQAFGCFIWKNGFQIIQTMRSLLRIRHIKLKLYGFKQAFSCNRGEYGTSN